MVVCTPCLLPVIKAGATGLTSVFAYSNARDRQFSKKAKKKNKKISTNSTGYSVVSEDLDKRDLDIIRKLIKDVVADIYRDIWLKRNSWKRAS